MGNKAVYIKILNCLHACSFIEEMVNVCRVSSNWGVASPRHIHIEIGSTVVCSGINNYEFIWRGLILKMPKVSLYWRE